MRRRNVCAARKASDVGSRAVVVTERTPHALDAVFAKTMARFGPFEPKPRLAVAVSGGADSLALALLADRWARAQGGRITAVTVDHALRPEAAAEARQVGRWLKAAKIRHVTLRWTPPAPLKKLAGGTRPANLQSAARDARYQLLTGWCRDHAVLHLLLAHHRDDQAETLLLRLARGSGLDGLAAMAPLVERASLRLLRPLLPAALQTHLPVRVTAGALPQRMHARSVLLLAGCVQPALAPQINAATSRVLDALGITVRIAADAGCCGAIHQHLDASERARAAARRNIDAWWPAIDAGAEAIEANTSGCGSMLRDYAVLLQHDEVYAARAARVVGLVRDLSEVVAPLASQLRPLLKAPVEARVVFQAPCSLQHAQRIRGSVEGLLSALGATLLAAGDAQLCCGAAGTYTLLQPQISTQLRQRKQAALTVAKPQIILSANLGCMLQLAAGSAVPVQHWVEWVDSQLV